MSLTAMKTFFLYGTLIRISLAKSIFFSNQSTLHDEVRVTKNERRKRDIYKLSDHTKSGVDMVDLISISCIKRIKNKNWPINAFACILETVQTNAKTTLQESTTKLKMSNFEFTYALGTLLVLPQIERGYANQNGIPIDLMHRIQNILGIPEVNHCIVTSTSAKTGWCYACVDDLVGVNVYKERREKLNARAKTSCSICNALICKQYTQFVCAKCNNRWKNFFKKSIKSLINSNDKADVQIRKYMIGQIILMLMSAKSFIYINLE